MEEISFRENPNQMSHVQQTKYFRIIQLILCFICLLLAILFWTTTHYLTITTVVIFATSLTFFIITLIDVIAGMKRNQYPITAWIGIAFLASFMFFLSFGFLLYSAIFIVTILAFAITAIAFLIDGVLIIRKLYTLYSKKRVHPTLEDRREEKEKKSDEIVLEEYIQTESVEPVNEVPVQTRTYAPRATAPSKKSSLGSNFPITTYGGTFPIGERDAAPLPTPDNLTGLEPNRSSQIHETRRVTREDPRGTEDVSTQKPSIDEGSALYPPLEEEIVKKQTYETLESSGPKTFETYYQSETSSTGREVQSTMRTSKLESQELNNEVLVCRRGQEDVQTETNWSYNPEDMQGRTVRPCQAAGEPMLQQPLGVFTIGSGPQDYQRRNCPSQLCQCCNRDLTTRDQVTPFVSHHYDQSPCICGYTHYQASTVVRGAVRQYPQDSVSQQQKMIQDQLEQTRQVYGPHVCGCHEQRSADTKQPQTRRESQDSRSTEQSDLSLHKVEYTNNELSDLSVYDSENGNIGPAIADFTKEKSQKNNSVFATRNDGDKSSFAEDDDFGIVLREESGKRVTIAEEPSSSSQGSTTRKYESWLKKMRHNRNEFLEMSKDENEDRNPKTYSSSEDDKTPGRNDVRTNNRRRGSEDVASLNDERVPTVMRLSDHINPPSKAGEEPKFVKGRHISPSLIANKTSLKGQHGKSRTISSPSSGNTEGSSPRRQHVVPCVKRCWETPERETTMKSMYWEKGAPLTTNAFGNVANLRTWGTEITTTTTVRTTNFGQSNDEQVRVCGRSDESSYVSSRSAGMDIDSSPDDKSYVSHEMIKQNQANLVTSSRPTKTSIYHQDKERNSRTVKDDEDYRCFVPCCMLPPLYDDFPVSFAPVLKEQAVERTEFEELQVEVPPQVPADEVELRRRSILKNRKLSDEDIQEEEAETEDEERSIEGRRQVEEQADDTSSFEERRSRSETERRVSEKRVTLEQIEELVEQEHTEGVESAPRKLSNRQNTQLENIEREIEDKRPIHEAVYRDKVMVKKMTCGCICKCLCRNAQMAAFRESQRTRNKYFDVDRYNVTSLNELPYHPRDDYKLVNSRLDKSQAKTGPKMSDVPTSELDYFWKNPIEIDRTSKVSDGFKSSKSIVRNEEPPPTILDPYFYESRKRSFEEALPLSQGSIRKTSVEYDPRYSRKPSIDEIDPHSGEASRYL